MNPSDSIPQRASGDIVHAIVKAAAGSVPVVGSAAAEFFQQLVQAPLERRRDAWMTDVSARLQRLERDGITPENLQQNEQFISTLIQATQISTRTHINEKRAALRNAVVNAARPGSPDDSEQQIFLNLVDSFTEWHIRILRLFHSPTAVPGLSGGGLSDVLEFHLPELRGKRDFYDQVWKDLYLRGLVNTDGLHVTMTGRGLTQQRTTQMGARFIKFIAE